MIIDKLMSPAVNGLLTQFGTGARTLIGTAIDLKVPANQGLIATTYGPGFVITLDKATSGGSATLTLDLVTSDVAALTSPEVLWTGAAIALAAMVGAGTQLFLPVPDSNAYKRYIGFRGQAGTAAFTAGEISIEYVANNRNWRAYPAVTGR